MYIKKIVKLLVSLIWLKREKVVNNVLQTKYHNVATAAAT